MTPIRGRGRGHKSGSISLSDPAASLQLTANRVLSSSRSVARPDSPGNRRRQIHYRQEARSRGRERHAVPDLVGTRGRNQPHYPKTGASLPTPALGVNSRASCPRTSQSPARDGKLTKVIAVSGAPAAPDTAATKRLQTRRRAHGTLETTV